MDPYCKCNLSTTSDGSLSGRCSCCISYTSPTSHREYSSRSSRSYDMPPFSSVITPLSNLVPAYTGCTGCVQFRMRRKNKTVTLQWEPFNGNLAASGIAYLTVAQSICNTPPYPLSIPIYLIYKGTGRITFIQIDPYATSGNIRFYLNTDGSTSNTNIGDNVSIPGGSITWIVD